MGVKMADKRADLAGPGISTYEEVDKIRFIRFLRT